VRRLRELGWIETRTVAIEYRWGEGRDERFAEIAAEFVRLKVDVILTYATPSSIAAKKATEVIPIVFAAAGDPLGTGLAASLARHGGNITGLSIQQTDLASKRLEMLREILPGLRTVAILGNISSPNSVLEMAEAQAAARTDRPRRGHIRGSKSRGYRARVRRAQGPRRCTLCLWLPASDDLVVSAAITAKKAD
jgi:putative ABC transport system substrate-binding protein